MGCSKKMTEKEYLNRYGVRGKDGFWYWRETYDGPLYENTEGSFLNSVKNFFKLN